MIRPFQKVWVISRRWFPRPRNVANPVEDSPQLVFPMGAASRLNSRYGDTKRPLLVRHVAGIPNPTLVPDPSMLKQKATPRKESNKMQTS
jgi:hypothetical protein